MCQNLVPVAEFESSDVVASGLDRPFFDVQENISLLSFKDEGQKNVPTVESEVGTRSSELKAPQSQFVLDSVIASGAVMGVGIPLSSPFVDAEPSTVEEMEVTYIAELLAIAELLVETRCRYKTFCA